MWKRLSNYSSGLSVIGQGKSWGKKYPSYTVLQSCDVLFLSSLTQLLTCKNTLFMNDAFHLNHYLLFFPCGVSWYGIIIHVLSIVYSLIFYVWLYSAQVRVVELSAWSLANLSLYHFNHVTRLSQSGLLIFSLCAILQFSGFQSQCMQFSME